MASTTDVLYQVDVTREQAHIILNKPEIHNAFNKAMILQLTDYFKLFNQDPNLRLLIITANGKNFSSGADLNWMKDSINYTEQENFQDANSLAKLFWELYNIDKPVISAVQGKVYGGALGLLACSDVVIASEDSQFCFAEVKLGLAPAVISLFMVKAMPGNFVKYSMLSSQPFTAQQAYQHGLVHSIVTTNNLSQATLGRANQILNNNLESIIAIKKLLRHTNSDITIEKLEICAKTIAKLRSSNKTQVLIKEFLDRTK